MTVEDLLKKRKQIKMYSPTFIPEKQLVQEVVDKTFELTASKQNLMPYKVHILGPEHKEYKEKFFELSKRNKGGGQNYNIKAPYLLIFTNRLVTNPNASTKTKIKLGHGYPMCDPNRYKKSISNREHVALEVGMFAKVLTALCMEKDFQVSYLLCFPDWEENDSLWKELDFIKDPVVFSMQIGYESQNMTITDNKTFEQKPQKEEIINWI